MADKTKYTHLALPWSDLELIRQYAARIAQETGVPVSPRAAIMRLIKEAMEKK